MLVVIDVERHGRPLPGLAPVRGAIGDQVVDLLRPAAVVAVWLAGQAVGEHEKVVAARRDCGARLEEPAVAFAWTTCPSMQGGDE
jgi:hypothetical protein